MHSKCTCKNVDLPIPCLEGCHSRSLRPLNGSTIFLCSLALFPCPKLSDPCLNLKTLSAISLNPSTAPLPVHSPSLPLQSSAMTHSPFLSTHRSLPLWSSFPVPIVGLPAPSPSSPTTLNSAVLPYSPAPSLSFNINLLHTVFLLNFKIPLPPY